MTDSKRSRLSSLLGTRRRRQKARHQNTSRRQLSSESLEDRVLLAHTSDITFSPNGFFPAAGNFEFASLDFLPGNALIQDYEGLVDGTSATGQYSYQAELGTFVNAGGMPVVGTGLNENNSYEVTATMTATVSYDAGLGLFQLAGPGTLNIYIDDNFDSSDGTVPSNPKTGQGYDDGTLFLSASFTSFSSSFTLESTSSLFDQFGPDDHYNLNSPTFGQMTVDGVGGTNINGTGFTTDPTFIITPVERIESFNTNASRITPFQQVDPSLVFLPLSANIVPNIGTNNGDPDLQFQSDGVFSFDIANAEIHGYKFHDLNANGVDDDEPRLSGVEIDLTGTSSQGFDISDSDVTHGDNGEFWFEHLPAGSYTVTETVPDGYMNSTPLAVDVALNRDQIVNNIRFGNFRKGSIHGVKFHDLDGDGVRDHDEPLLGGVKFTLTGTTGLGDPVGPLVETSDDDGRFWFTDLVPGAYTVTEELPPGFVVSGPGSVDVTVTSGSNTDLELGNYIPGSIHGIKCEDIDADGRCGPRLGTDPHVVFVIDISGSTEEDSGVDLDGDGTNETVLEVEIAAVEEAVDFMATFGINAEIGVVAFDGGTNTAALDMDPTGGTLSFTTPTADLDGNGTSDVIDALNNLVPAGLTNYEVALETAAALLAPWNAPPENSYVVFISDGVPTEGDTLGNLADEVAALEALADNISAFGFNTADLTHLQAIDPDAMIFTDPSDLLDAFEFAAQVDPPFPGVTFELIDAAGDVVASEVTNDKGEFWFLDVIPGNYILRESLSDEIMSSTHADGEIELHIGSGEELVWQAGAAHLGSVVGRHIFYNDSAFDGDGTALSSADDDAIAPDKTAYLGSGAATFANYTSYVSGINGIMIDIANAGAVTEDDFEFRVGNDNDPSSWSAAPAPSGFDVRAGEGDGGSDRISISWDNGAIKKEWLQVVVKANARTNISKDDIHYWGNAIGETGNDPSNAHVNAADASAIMNNSTGFGEFAGITNVHDINRDNLVGAADTSAVMNNPSMFSPIILLEDPTAQERGCWKQEVLVGMDLVFGNYVKGSIHGFKYRDNDADGVYDPNVDTPWEGLEFLLAGTDGLGNSVTGSGVTNADGEFWFTGLVPGTYTVTENLPDEAVPSTDTSWTGKIESRQEYVWKRGAAMLPAGGDPIEIWYDDDFSSDWAVNGDAFVPVGEGGIHLADADQYSSGSAILEDKLDITTFSAAFTFQIKGQGGTEDVDGDPGADGIAFLLQPTSTTELGADGGGIGYGGLAPSVVVEFDTWNNNPTDFPATADPSTNHIGININGSTMSIATADITPDFDNGDVWYAWVDYNGTTLDVFVSTTSTKPGSPNLSAAVDIAAVLGSTDAYPGFTAATGGAYGDHDLLSFHWEAPGEPESLRHEVVVGDELMFGNYVPGSIHGYKCEDLNLNGVCEPRVIGDDPHIVFTVDYSASTLDDSGVDLDGDGTNETVLDVEIAAVTQFVEWLASQSINAEIGIVAFHGNFPASNADAAQLDMDPTGGTLAFTTPTADLDGNGVIDVVDALYSEAAYGLTNYQAALNVTTDLLAQWDGQANLPEDGYVIFISDGVPTVGQSGANLADEVAALSAYADHIRAFGINAAELEELKPIDPNAEFFSDPTDLMDIFMFMAPMAGDPPMPGVPFELLDDAGNIVATETTNDQGEFWFTGLKPGHYTVKEGDLSAAFPDDNVMPVPGTQTETDIWVRSHEEHVWQEGAAMIPDGSERYEVGPNENLIFTDFIKGSIHGFKFHDRNLNGHWDPDTDTPFPGIEFILLDATGAQVGDPVATNDEGEFWFDDLIPGDYTVVELDHPSGEVRPTTHTSVDVTVGSGQEIVWATGAAHLPHGSLREEIVKAWDLSFGNYVLTSVHGFKFQDNDADGVYDPDKGDTPWEGFTFILESDHDLDGIFGADDPDGEYSGTQVSGPDGQFWFTHLEPCTYRLREVLTDEQIAQGVVQSPPKELTIYIESGEEVVWVPGAAMLDETAPSVKHEFFFDGPGDGEVEGNGYWDALTFGNYLTGSIHGFKFEDHNVDGVYNPEDGDDRLGGILFELVRDGVVVDTGISNPLGEFWFTDLEPGTYTVREVLDHFGLVSTTPTEWTVLVGSGEEYVWRAGAAHLPDGSLRREIVTDHLLFGNAILGSMHGFKFEDYDGDGVYEPDADTDPDDGRDENDKPWANFPFEIIGDIDGDGDIDTIMTVTDENGEFWLDLYPGEYTVREKLEDVHPDVVPTTYPSGEATFFVGSGEELAWQPGASMPDRLQHEVVEPGLAFGNAYLGSIHGCVFHDENGDGEVQPGEMVLGGVELEITNSAGDVVGTMTTWVDGLYWFEDLPPDTYTITAVNLPPGAFAWGPVVEFVGSREELVHADDAAHLAPTDPQIEVNLGAELYILVVLPEPAAAAGLGGFEADIADVTGPVVIAPEVARPLNSLRSRARLLDASLLSYVNEREALSKDQNEDLADEEDELFSLLAADRRL